MKRRGYQQGHERLLKDQGQHPLFDSLKPNLVLCHFGMLVCVVLLSHRIVEAH